MKLFGRRRGVHGRADPAPRPSPGGDRPDPNLAMLSVDEAAWLLALVRRAFAEQGRETVHDGLGALRGDGQVYGLHNLAAHVSGTPRRAWPQLARRHVRDMLAADLTPQPESLEEVRDQVLLKLRPLGDLPGGPPDYAPEVLPGVVAVAAIDYPTHVSELLDAERLEPLGGWEAVRPVAMENLRRLRVPRLEVLEAEDGRTDSTVTVLLADDFFGAARVCVLDTLVASVLGVERPAHGVLVAVPNRHVLALHLPAGEGVVAALHLMITLATQESSSAPGPISPFVYLLPPSGPAEQVTRRGQDGETIIDVRGALADLFEEFGLLGDPDEGDPLDGEQLEGDPLEGDLLDGDLLDGEHLGGDLLDGGELVDGEQLEGDPLEGDLDPDRQDGGGPRTGAPDDGPPGHEGPQTDGPEEPPPAGRTPH